MKKHTLQFYCFCIQPSNNRTPFVDAGNGIHDRHQEKRTHRLMFLNIRLILRDVQGINGSFGRLGYVLRAMGAWDEDKTRKSEFGCGLLS